MSQRRIVIAGNWKMYNTVPEARTLIQELKKKLPKLDDHHEVILCPPFLSVAAVKSELDGSPMKLGAQNLYPEPKGAFTGEVSAPMVKAAGCTHVILGHSERRRYFGETDEFINKKVHAAHAEGLIPIVCVGETLEEREAGKATEVVSRQVRGVLAGLTEAQLRSTISAYEPVWAIGTGRNATPEQAEEVHALIRSLLAGLYGAEVAESITIQYGGSVKADNAASLLRQPNVDGALVGGACLQADSFVAIIAAGLTEKP